MREPVAMRNELGPQLCKVPSIGNKIHFEFFAGTDADHFGEVWMQRWLAASETDFSYARDFFGLTQNAPQQIQWQELGAAMVESIFVAKAIAAMQIADIRCFDS